MDPQTKIFNEFCGEIMRYQHDPLGFVKVIYPWGEGALQNAQGPRDWHCEALKRHRHQVAPRL